MIEQNLDAAQPMRALPAPPKTSGWPLVGSLPAFLRQPFDYLLAARARHGDIYTLDAGPMQLVVLNHPRLAEHVLRDNSHTYLRGGVFYESLAAFLGNGLAASDGPYWLRQRRMMQPHFHRKRLAALTELMAATIEQELAAWAPAARSDEPFELVAGFSRLTMKVLVRTIFGTALSDREADTLATEIAYVIDHIFVDALAKALPAWLPIPGVRRYRQARAVVDAALYDVIARARRGDGDSSTLLTMMLDMVDAETGEQMTDQQLRDEAVTLVLAGYETTSLTLAWACQFMAERPDMLARLTAEVDTALGGRTPGFADVPALAYTGMVVQETLRLRPPAWVFSRRAEADDTIDGYRIAKGTIVVMVPYTVHHHPGLWDDAERFDPERFTPERAAQYKSAWMPFGLGQHQCIGKDFALIEAQLILAMLVQRYQIAPTGPAPAPQLSGTLRPKGGVRVRLAPHS